MAIEYDLVPGPGSKTNSNNEAQRLVPKIVTRSTVSFKQMAEDISHATSFTEADIVGMMDAIATFASQYLNNSMHVELAGLGTPVARHRLSGRCRRTPTRHHPCQRGQAAPTPRDQGHPHRQADIYEPVTGSLRPLQRRLPLQCPARAPVPRRPPRRPPGLP